MAATPHNRPRPARQFTTADRERLWRAYPEVFNAGARTAFCLNFACDAEPGGFPRGYWRWPREKRDAWRAGFCVGLHDHLRYAAEMERRHGG